MNNGYVIEPTDVVHGKEWKSHKYIKKVMNKGKWVYYYAKNRARGNKVTNKNGKIQYSPNIKTDWGSTLIDGHLRDATFLLEPISKYSDIAWQGLSKYTTGRIMSTNFAKKQAYTNRSPYSYDNDGNWVDKQYAPNYKKSKGTNYAPPQSSRAASSRYYTPNIRTFSDGTLGEHQGHGIEKNKYGTSSYDQYTIMNTTTTKRKRKRR